MEMITQQINGTNVLQLIGRFDAYAASDVEELLRKMNLVHAPRVIVNLAQVDFIDSTALAALVIGMKRCRQQQGDLTLCNIQKPIHTIFALTRLDKIFTITDTQEEALAQIQKQQKG
jgi:anti-sigma B factor antagonist